MEIIPTIIAKDFKEVQVKIKQAEPFFKWLQLDIMDGQFVANTTWQNPNDLKNLSTILNLEAHLMVVDPLKQAENWLMPGIKRIIIHWEAVFGQNLLNKPKLLEQLIAKIKNQRVEFGVAINPETAIVGNKNFCSLLKQIDLVLVMTVLPGKAGQVFMPEVLPKIKQLRQIWPSGKISVDGGIDLESARQCQAVGADILCVGSYLWQSADMAQAINNLQN